VDCGRCCSAVSKCLTTHAPLIASACMHGHHIVMKTAAAAVHKHVDPGVAQSGPQASPCMLLVQAGLLVVAVMKNSAASAAATTLFEFGHSAACKHATCRARVSNQRACMHARAYSRAPAKNSD